MSEFNTDTTDLAAEEFTAPSAGPVPTQDELDAADRSADDVDLGKVAAHYDEMNGLGANVKGEGAIDPTADQ
jgi:hypothetical protein